MFWHNLRLVYIQWLKCISLKMSTYETRMEFMLSCAYFEIEYSSFVFHSIPSGISHALELLRCFLFEVTIWCVLYNLSVHGMLHKILCNVPFTCIFAFPHCFMWIVPHDVNDFHRIASFFYSMHPFQWIFDLYSAGDHFPRVPTRISARFSVENESLHFYTRRFDMS